MEDDEDGKLFASFEKHQEFSDLQRSLLSLDFFSEPSAEEDRTEALTVQNLVIILSEYQEQAYLLDPFLEELISPVVETLKAHAKAVIETSQTSRPGSRIGRIALLLYNYVKFRGYKTITRFFPHEIADLSLALEFISSSDSPTQDPYNWALRYVTLLWLSLICMIPFDLEQFDEPDSIGNTAAKIEIVAKSYLSKAGLEREGAAILLSRLYLRKDTSVKLPGFLQWSISTIQASVDPFPCIGLLLAICEIVKSGSADQVKSHLSQLMKLAGILEQQKSLTSNTVVRKFRTKLVSRVVLRLLPARTGASRSKGRALSSATVPELVSITEDEDFDVPKETETVLEELLRALQDKDTIVRWSAAKGIARIAERLPAEFAGQVLETVVGLFSIHSIAAASMYDMSSVAESTWHGACLACAEIARKGLIADDKLPDLVDWLTKALYFDIRKGAHSIGSNVRDAASYALWSLARAQGTASLAPHADHLSRTLAVVSLYDREIHIRRAASATFQEYVGRTSLFPHGIDVLRKTDFYAVGIRRNAFLIAAAEVAEHLEYRTSLIDHLLKVTLRHWDPVMRQLGAQSLRALCALDLANLGPDAAHRASQLLGVPDTGDIHGALLALAEIAAAYRDSIGCLEVHPERRKVFSYLNDVPLDTILSPRHELITSAACILIANAITSEETHNDQSAVPHWRRIVDAGLKSRSTTVQEAAAAAMATVSKLVDCSAVVNRLIQEFRVGSPQMQQSLCRVLGVLDYTAHPHGILEATRCLLNCVDRSARGSVHIEARRNAYVSLPLILANVASELSRQIPADVVCQIIDALQDGLDDYSTDERGDVGSWVRMACIKGLTSVAETLFTHASTLPNFEQYFPAGKYHNAIGGILKQGVERLDNVRQQAGECFVSLLDLPLPPRLGAEQWRVRGEELMKELFLGETEAKGWNDSAWLYPRAVKLLDIEDYREAVLRGLVLSASSRTDSTQRPVAASLVSYAQCLPVSTHEKDRYDLLRLCQDLIKQASQNFTSNNVVVPVLQTFNVLLEADVFEPLAEHSEGSKSLQALLSISSKNVSRLKNVQRILMTMKIVVNLLPLEQLRRDCIVQLSNFLSHQYPKVRSETAEYVYLVLQSKDLGCDTDDAEAILLDTEWSSSDSNLVADATARCIKALESET
ncbi:TBCD protein [Obba rivulosa]|uniref:TBCD protein n=1 Tax=Obba rivulosa TaxID=1052685 RepID=A0A8E2DL19_9APHY|nr:TBCD protein [Obba rivulosa]